MGEKVDMHRNEMIEKMLPEKLHAIENGQTNRIINIQRALHSSRHRCFCLMAGSILLNFLLLLGIVLVIVVRRTEAQPSFPTTTVALCPTLPTTPAVKFCPDGWVGFQRKCYYFAEAQGDWLFSKMNCSSFNASLAVIDSREEMIFMRRYKSLADHWVGLQRDVETKPWKWINGTIFNNWFTIRGAGVCAYMNHQGIASSSCLREEPWICSKPVDR